MCIGLSWLGFRLFQVSMKYGQLRTGFRRGKIEIQSPSVTYRSGRPFSVPDRFLDSCPDWMWLMISVVQVDPET